MCPQTQLTLFRLLCWATKIQCKQNSSNRQCYLSHGGIYFSFLYFRNSFSSGKFFIYNSVGLFTHDWIKFLAYIVSYTKHFFFQTMNSHLISSLKEDMGNGSRRREFFRIGLWPNPVREKNQILSAGVNLFMYVKANKNLPYFPFTADAKERMKILKNSFDSGAA